MAKKAGLTRQQIEESIRKKQFSPIYLLMGEEAFYIDRLSDMVMRYALSEEERDFNLTVCYGSDVTLSDVLLDCRRYPMMADRQVIILREAQALKTQKQNSWELLQKYALNPTPTTVLVICYKGGSLKSAPLTKALATNFEGKPVGTVFESQPFRDYNITPAVAEYAQSVGCRIQEKALAMLVENIGTDMSLLAKEVDKLKMIAPNGAAITPEMVEENVGISKEYNNFELIAAVAQRNVAKTFKIIRYFRNSPKKNPTVITTTVLFNFFANLLIAYYTPERDNDNVLMEALRMKTSYALRDYRTGMRNFNARQTLQAIVAIREFDARSKGIGSSRNEYDLLEELIFKLFNL